MAKKKGGKAPKQSKKAKAVERAPDAAARADERKVRTVQMQKALDKAADRITGRIVGRGASFIIGDSIGFEGLWPSPGAKAVHIGIGIDIGAEPADSSAGPKPLPESLTDLLKVEPRPVQKLIPPDAHAAPWERVHEFHPQSTRPTRTIYGLICPDPPIALRCPACELRQPPLGAGGSIFGGDGRRLCPYCGITLITSGTMVMWWR